jgi:hypothetical protein
MKKRTTKKIADVVPTPVQAAVPCAACAARRAYRLERNKRPDVVAKMKSYRADRAAKKSAAQVEQAIAQADASAKRTAKRSAKREAQAVQA